jgi:2-polyprenyl-3-methyl-5-hydroxy-6-metoxy-1,4-benzoquinol methylase
MKNIIKNLIKKLLSFSAVRKVVYKKAFDQRLRKNKLGVLIMVCLNELFTKKQSLHDELFAFTDNYQKTFWESDFGFLWYNANKNKENEYHKLVQQIFDDSQSTSLLDIGCGWGQLPYLIAKNNKSKVLGIDISEKVINVAKQNYQHPSLVYKMMNVLDIPPDKFDLISVISCADYFPADKFPEYVDKILNSCNKEVIIIHSLRNTDFDAFMTLKKSKEVRRYDIGYVHPFMQTLNGHSESFLFSCKKIGLDSVIIRGTRK